VKTTKIHLKKIYSFWDKKAPFSHWKKALSESFKIREFYLLEKFLDALLFNPPDLVIYYYHKSPEGLEIFIRDIKLQFNLVRLPLLLVINHDSLRELENYLKAIDDFFFLNSSANEVLLRVELSLRRIDRISDNNPLTGLPGNVSIERNLYKVLESERPYAIGYLDLDNFKAYNDLYGFSRGDELIKNVARILVTTISSHTRDGFVGHIGGDDFVFIVPLESVEKVAEEVIKKFETLIPKLVSRKDLERGYFISKDRQGKTCTFPLPSISIAIVPVKKGKFTHIGEIAERAGQIKKLIKAQPGSVYFVDRRA
jgi:diguanylate cyclase (GGDEF)-like protein